MIYGYIRVSTDRQTTKNQKHEIEKFCKKEKIHIDQWIMETISGTKDLNKRELGKLLKSLEKNDILIASELSRLGRNLLQVMSILHYCMNKDIQVWTIKDRYRLGADIQSKVLAFAFGLSAEIERNLISQRTKEALDRIKSEGKHVGRPMGKRNQSLMLDKYSEKIEEWRRDEIPLTFMANLLKCNRKTVYSYVRLRKM